MSRGRFAAFAIGGLGCGALSLLLLEPPAPSSDGSATTSAPLHALPCAPASTGAEGMSSPTMPQPAAPRAGATQARLCGSAAERARRGPIGVRVGRPAETAARGAVAGGPRGEASSATARGAEDRRLSTRLTGRVVDERGFPLAGVQVASLDPAARALTDDRGGFELKLDRSAAPSRSGLVIQARAEGYLTGQRVVVSQKPELSLDLSLARKTEEAALTVSVLSARGERVARERVFVTPVGSVDTFSSPTDDDGSCRLASLGPGQVVVWLRAPDGTPALQRRVDLLAGENHLDLRLP